MKDSYPRKSRWAVLGRDPVWWHRLLLAEWNSQILPPISESPSARTAADTAARSPAVCAAAIPNNRPRGPALNLTPAKNWPRRNYASHILYDNIMRTHGPGIFCNEKLNCRLNIQVDLHHNYSEVKVWVKGTLYKDLTFITILVIDKGTLDMWWPLTCTFLPKVGLMTWWHWWPLGTSIYSLPYLTKSDQHVIKKLQ